ncbi:hypothetical protein C8Q80DRAFT_145059 [Daedaleopsis nitida]|nr:hypothetical protein C8Q80DRAFT_145059 [Daedaleopsis nitida]
MSRRHPGGHALPDNPSWLEFPRSDGDVRALPKNTTKIVDSEGEVNYMRPIAMDESLAILWRVSVGAAVATRLGLPEGPKYVLKDWPTGYQFFDHNKGNAKSPRHDPYLYGSVHVNRFRSTNEFIPHAYWLMTDESLNRANCQCKYCTKQPQKVISDNMGLSARRSASIAAGLPRSAARASRGRRDADGKQRRQERSSTKPFAAVRRAPKPPKLLVGPTQYVSPERDIDIRTSICYHPMQRPRRYRKGELLWCHLDPPVSGPSPEEDISFWPGIVEEALIKAIPVPVALPDGDVNMEHLYAEAQDGNSDLGGPAHPSAPGSPILPPTAPVEAEGKVPWVVEQWYVYRIKLLGTSYIIHLREEEVLPYLAYAPSDVLLGRIQVELNAFLQDVPIEEMDRDLERHMFTFDPLGPADGEESAQKKYRQSAAPFTLGIQVASNIAQFWLPTDEWECTFTLPAPPAPSTSQQPIPSQPLALPPNVSLHSAIQQSLINNAMSPASMHAPNGSTTEPESISMAGRPSRSANKVPQTVVQTRFQGLWWGTERIWTDELVRLKIARSQFAPKGTDVIFPPAGPSASTIARAKASMGDEEFDLASFGAGERGLFLRLEGLVVVDVPVGDGQCNKECRASGMLYELVDEDWEEEEPLNQILDVSGKGKGKAREEPDVTMSISQGPGGPSFMAQPSPMKPPPLPKPDPTVPPSQTANDILSQTSPAAAASVETSQQPNRKLDLQLSHPVLSTHYPLPPASKGYRFRPILPPEHEVVISLSLISGRYYPGLLHHPLLQSARNDDNVLQYRHLWALDGLAPGVHQSMDPRAWKDSRLTMFQEADAEARDRFREKWEELKMGRLHPQEEMAGEDSYTAMDVD